MMKGWKTWVGAGGVFAGGVAMVATGLTAEPINPDLVYKGLVVCSGSFAAVGLGHKIEKSS